MAESLVREEYAVNYQKDSDKVLENIEIAENLSDQVSEYQSVFLAWICG